MAASPLFNDSPIEWVRVLYNNRSNQWLCATFSKNGTIIIMLLTLFYYSLYHLIALAIVYRVYHQHIVAIHIGLDRIANSFNFKMENQTIATALPLNVGTSVLKIAKDQVTMPPPPLPSPSRGPTTSNSNVTAMRTMKRPSLSFSIQPVQQNNQRRSSLAISSPGRLSSSSSPEPHSLSSTDPNAFLTALAAQERRVLELKEELQKAEVDLDILKKQWAMHEAAKKRNEMRHVEPLRPLSSPTRNGMEVAEGERRASREDEGKRVSIVKGKQGQRKFEGGKHIRALSLLSPPSHVQERKQAGSHGVSTFQEKQKMGRLPVRSATMDSTPVRARASSAVTFSDSKGTKEDLVNTGKQLVGDLKEGLWTFIEDLRQATVGDEATNGSRPRHKRNSSLGKPSARSSSRIRAQTSTPSRAASLQRRLPDHLNSPILQPKKRDALIDTDTTTASIRTSLPTTSPSPVTHKDGIPPKQPPSDALPDDESWDNWDSRAAHPSPSTASTATHNSPRTASPSPATSTPRTSLRFVSQPIPVPIIPQTDPHSSFDTTPRAMRVLPSRAQADPLPWPTLPKLSPGSLTRTAATLMGDWEASLAGAGVGDGMALWSGELDGPRFGG